MVRRQSISKRTWTDVKAKLASFDRIGLLGLVQDLYAAHKDNQTFLHARFGLGADVLTPYVSAGIKQPHYCRFCRPPPGRGRGRYSTPDSKFYLAEPRCWRYYRACANWSSSRGRSIA